MSAFRTRPLAALLAAGLTVVAAAGLTTGATASAAPRAGVAALPAGPRTPRGLSADLESMTPYVGDVACDPHTRSGTRRLAELLTRTYRGTAYNTTYACGTDGTRSEHYDGRAIDWMVDVHDRRQHADALSFLNWLLASDRSGNRFAMARRLGVMYVIYDNRMWGSWDGRWEQYNGCFRLRAAAYDNSCHRTHVHISLSWNGATGRTTFWGARTPAPTDYGPCRPADMSWAGSYTGRNLRGCASQPVPRVPRGSSAVTRALITYSGGMLRRGSSGPAVDAVQRALRMPVVTDRFGPGTRQALLRFQRRRGLPATGVTTARTWRRLIAFSSR